MGEMVSVVSLQGWNGFASVAIKPISIEALVLWAFQSQRVDVVTDRGVGMFAQERMADGQMPIMVSPDGVYLIGTTGQRVDGGGISTCALHEDAETLYRIVSRSMPLHQRIAIQEFGKSGLVPDAMANPVQVLVPARDLRGKPIKLYDNRKHCIGVRMELYPSDSYIAMKRAAYAEWWQAMDDLIGLIDKQGGLTAHLISGHEYEKAPWILE